MITDDTNVLFAGLDGTDTPEKELLNTIIAAANSGGGIIYAEHENFCESRKLADYISGNTCPSVYAVIDRLFPETGIRITVFPSKKQVSSSDGNIFILNKDFRPIKLYENFSEKDALKDRFFCEPYENVFDRRKIRQAYSVLGKRKKYREIGSFDEIVFLKTISAVRCSRLGIFPTASGVMLFGKKESIRRLLPNSGIEYTLYGPKRETFKKLYFSGMTVYELRNAIYYEIIKDSRCCAEADSFLFAFSLAFTSAVSLRGSRKESPVRIYNRNGIIEISFIPQRKRSEKLAETSPFRTEIGKIIKLFGLPYFSAKAFRTAKVKMTEEGFGIPEFEDRIQTVMIRLDFKHKLK